MLLHNQACRAENGQILCVAWKGLSGFGEEAKANAKAGDHSARAFKQ